MAIATVDPSTGKTVKAFSPHSREEVERALAAAVRAFQRHRRTSFEERAQRMVRAAELLEAERDAYAELMAREMGKPLAGGVAEVTKCAATCRYYAQHAARFLADVPLDAAPDTAFLRSQPLGVVLAVMPWNFPFWQVVRFAAPALMAGNVGLLKHASNVPQCALALQALFARAGFEEGCFQTVLIDSSQVGPLIEDARVAAVTLTGSNAAGSAVASAAGRACKKTVLELGGSDAFIVLPSADVERAAEVAVQARVLNNGQSCVAAKRFIVAEPVAQRFEQAMARGLAALVVGPPTHPKTQVGPLVSRQAVEELDSQVQRSLAAGARLVVGGTRREGEGFYYLPTLLADVPHTAAVAREETFGPVAALFRVKGVEEAIALANESPFGLGSSVWTRDAAEQRACIDGLEVGGVFVNQLVASDPRLPFGGVKQSGYGRELGELGIREFMNLKTVRIARVD